MTRATRSQTTQHIPNANTQAHSLKKTKDLKKRKRGNAPDDDHDDTRLKKQARRGSTSQDNEQLKLDPERAQAILEILEESVQCFFLENLFSFDNRIDSQGLLDRAFPVTDSEALDQPFLGDQPRSLRSLLQGTQNLGTRQLQVGSILDRSPPS
jgi:hypothetical protein